MNNPLSIDHVLGEVGPVFATALAAGRDFLQRHPDPELLARIGQVITEVPAAISVDKGALQDSFGGNQLGPTDDFLVGRGLFYLTEQRRLFLDCTSGHYQMLWGYCHPELSAAVAVAMREGVVWDNHSNLPQAPVKVLARRLVEKANPPGEKDPLNTVLLGVCTGSVACAAALKIQLKVYRHDRASRGIPVLVVLAGNYHGTDMIPQCLRGMWPELVHQFEVVTVEPNHYEDLERIFQRLGSRVAGFWAEPVMMNREAIPVEADFLRQASRWCGETGALLCVDEIQTGFWRPEIFEYRTLDVHPDLVIAGKGMTAGFHPLAAVLLKQRHDVLAQYDAISTNGSASLPSYVALCSLHLIQAHAENIRRMAHRIETGFHQLAAEFPDQLQTAQGRGYLAGLKFRHVQAALDFHRRALQAGLWTRVHAYHAGHSTVLTKLGLLTDETALTFLLDRLGRLLRDAKAKTA